MPVAEFPEPGAGLRRRGFIRAASRVWRSGRLEALRGRLHAAGLAVLLDVVYNHLGPSGNYLACFGPYFTTKYHTPWGPAVNSGRRRSSEVRRFFCDNALMWLRDYHFDGLRIDAIHAFVDQSAVPFLEQLAGEVEAAASASRSKSGSDRRERLERSRW